MSNISPRDFIKLERRLRWGIACLLPRPEPPSKRKRTVDLGDKLIEEAAKIARPGDRVCVADLARTIGVRTSSACRCAHQLGTRFPYRIRRGTPSCDHTR